MGDVDFHFQALEQVCCSGLDDEVWLESGGALMMIITQAAFPSEFPVGCNVKKISDH